MDQHNCEKGRYFECIHHGGRQRIEFFFKFNLYII